MDAATAIGKLRAFVHWFGSTQGDVERGSDAIRVIEDALARLGWKPTFE